MTPQTRPSKKVVLPLQPHPLALRLLVGLMCALMLVGCLPGSSPSPTPAPGLVLKGHVRLSDGSPLAGVTICRNFASYEGQVVAQTDQNGYYEAAFVAIPGDEMVGVWAILDGHAFEPEVVSWRHYFGFEEQTLDFVATPTTTPGLQMPCS